MIELIEPDPPINKPSDDMLIQSLADAWHVDFQTAAQWLREVDFTNLN